MAFAINCAQQINFDDSFNNLSDREKRFLGKSWAKGFADNIFPAITEERFAVLYSGGTASRPNTPVIVIVGSLLLKEMFGLADEELLESILFDVRFQYALHTTSFDEQPYSDRTPSRFRERLQCYETETGIDLLAEEMKAMAEKICQFFNITPGTKRMDSVMISSSCKKMSRLELIYTCVANMVKAIHATGEDGILGKGLRKYLKEENHNAVIYRSKPEEIGNHLQSTIRDAVELLKVCADGYGEMEEYILTKAFGTGSNLPNQW